MYLLRLVLQVARWAIAAIFILLAIGFFYQPGFGIPVASVLVAAAVLVAPIPGDWVGRVAFQGRPWASVVLAIALVVIGVPLSMISFGLTSDEMEARTQALIVKNEAKAAEDMRIEEAARAERVKKDKLAVEERARKAKEKLLAERSKQEQDRLKACNDTTGAYLISRDFMRDRLVAPTTAKFPRSNAQGVVATALGDCRFLVRAFVDAQNVFGAMIRTTYEMELRLDYSTERWHALSVDTD